MERADGHTVRGLLAVVIGAAGFLVAGGSPAAADEPTVVVTPDHVVEGQLVGMDISGFPDGYNVLVECSGRVLDAPVHPAGHCAVLQYLAIPGVPPPHADWVVVGAFTTYDGTMTVDCRQDPFGCVAGVVTVSSPSDPTSVIAAAYDRIVFLPTFRGMPNRQLAEGATVAVHGEDAATGDWSVAQCGRAVVDDPAQAPALCGPATAVTPDAAGTFDAQVVVHDPVVPSGGDPVPCGYDGCVLVLSTTDEPVVRSFGISFGPTTISVEPDTDVVPYSNVEIEVAGAPDEALVHQCVLPLGTNLADSRCASPYAFQLDDWGGAVLNLNVPNVIQTTTDPTPVDCRVEPCGFVLIDGSGAPVGEPAPISFAPPPVVSLDPVDGLLDGQPMTVTGRHLLPGVEHRMLRCSGPACVEVARPTATPEGTIDITLPAAQRFTAVNDGNVYCRANCAIVVLSGLPSPLVLGYAMAPGSLAASPDAGLVDGQQVHITGTDLMTSYAGPVLGVFPSGGWALTECDQAVVAEATLFGVFRHCAVLPPTRPVTIEGSTLDTTLNVKSSIAKILGGTTDCTAAPGVCVVGLVRFEQDGSLSTHLVPIAFG